MASTRSDDPRAWVAPAARALGELETAPDARVMGLAVRVLLELSRARGTADVTALVSGYGALLLLPEPGHLRREVGGLPGDKPPTQIKLREWLPMGVTPEQANNARRFLRAHLMCDELAAFRAGWRYSDDGTANNVGCGAGLEWVQCRYCGLANVESGPKHLRTKGLKKLHEAQRSGYEQRIAAELETAEHKRRRIATESEMVQRLSVKNNELWYLKHVFAKWLRREPTSHGLDSAPDKYRGDYDHVLAAVQCRGADLDWASDGLKDNKNIVLAAVKQEWTALMYASRVRRDDREIVLAALKESRLALRYASTARRNDDDIVRAAVTGGGYVDRRETISMPLRYASRRLRNNHGIVLAAVQQNDRSLSWASKRLQADSNIAVAATLSCICQQVESKWLNDQWSKGPMPKGQWLKGQWLPGKRPQVIGKGPPAKRRLKDPANPKAGWVGESESEGEGESEGESESESESESGNQRTRQRTAPERERDMERNRNREKSAAARTRACPGCWICDTTRRMERGKAPTSTPPSPSLPMTPAQE